MLRQTIENRSVNWRFMRQNKRVNRSPQKPVFCTQTFQCGPSYPERYLAPRHETILLQRTAMKIEHSPLMNEFISFWIETCVDGALRYETFLDFMRSEWYTVATTDDQNIILRGKLNSALSEDDMIEEIKPIIDSAIASGTI